MGIPIVIATNGYGTPITEAANGYGTPVEVATNGYGVPVVIVASGGLPVVGSGGAASAYAPESETIFAAFTTPPTTARKNLIDACVVALKTAGVWAKLDALYAFAAADSQAAKINWKAPGTFNCTEINSPTFTADRGFDGASTKYLDSNFNPATAPSPKWVTGSACAFGWSVTDVNVAGGIVGNIGNSTFVMPRNGGQAYSTINVVGGGTFLIVATANSLGLFTGVRWGAGAGEQELYKNGSLIYNTGSSAASAPISETTIFLRRGGEYWTGQIGAGGFGASLTAADNTALYNALAAYMAGLATDRIAAAFTTPPSAARKTLIQNCVTSLMQGGVWDKLDALYAFAAADSQAALINWKQPGTYNGTLVNAPSFVADSGFTGNGTTSYIDSGFDPSVAPTPQYTLNSASMFAHSLYSGASTAGMVGSSVAYAFLQGRYTDNNAYTRLNQNAANLTSASTDAIGFWHGSRTSASANAIYRNGVSLATSATAPSNLPTSIWFERYLTLYWGGTLACGGIGSGLNSTEATALYNALRTYLTGVGVP